MKIDFETKNGQWLTWAEIEHYPGMYMSLSGSYLYILPQHCRNKINSAQASLAIWFSVGNGGPPEIVDKDWSTRDHMYTRVHGNISF